MIVAAAHRQQPARMRVERNNRSLHRRSLRKGEIAGTRLKPVTDQVGRFFRRLHHRGG